MKKTRSLLDELKKERGQILAAREEHKSAEDAKQKPPLVKRRPAHDKAAFTFSPIPSKT